MPALNISASMETSYFRSATVPSACSACLVLEPSNIVPSGPSGLSGPSRQQQQQQQQHPHVAASATSGGGRGARSASAAGATPTIRLGIGERTMPRGLAVTFAEIRTRHLRVLCGGGNKRRQLAEPLLGRGDPPHPGWCL